MTPSPTPWDAPAFEQARALQSRVGLIDLHVDSIIQQRLFGYDLRRRHRARRWGQPRFWHADIPRMREAGYAGACMGIHYWPWQSERGWRELNRQIDYLDAVAEADPGCARVRSFEDWARARAEGKLALAPGVEGAHMLNGRLERVATLAARGVAYMTLTHFSKNAAATPSMGLGANERDGLSAFGRELVVELQRHGVVIDVAHVNTPGALEACALARAPVLCTHTGVKHINDVARNISDATIDAIAACDGAIGIIFGPGFLVGRKRASTEVVLDHMAHVIERVGARHLIIGSDYDGWLPSIPSDQRDCRDIVRVTEGLRARGLSEEAIGGVLRDNALRVFAAAAEAREVTPPHVAAAAHAGARPDAQA